MKGQDGKGSWSSKGVLGKTDRTYLYLFDRLGVHGLSVCPNQLATQEYLKYPLFFLFLSFIHTTCRETLSDGTYNYRKNIEGCCRRTLSHST